MSPSPCLRCGACCAMFCVSFPEEEADDMPGGYVPSGMTLSLAVHTRTMRGTSGRNPKCAALSGIIGSSVRCGIYENRPSPCRTFKVSWENRQGNSLCDQARSVYGLTPFSP